MNGYSINKKLLVELNEVYKIFKDEIKKRLESFKNLGNNGNKKEIFAELAFCILTPQSRAKICWKAIKKMSKNETLLKGSREEILKDLEGVRFKYKKSYFVLEAREKFFNKNNPIYYFIKNKNNPYETRDYLIKNIKGLGCKEASHFLRNVGLGRELAILDRHILRNLRKLGVIKDLKKTCTERTYKEIERKMKDFSMRFGIPLDQLDLLLWAKETGEVFK
jgi:N-glycosylase/DNA lyase